ncbi:MAG TPA: PH domain-containing protein [Gemmatimonadaceae bacterium]
MGEIISDGKSASYASKSDDDASINRALERLRAILVPGEALQAFAVQRRLFALTHRRVLVAATSGRLITVSRGLFGGFTPHDIRWQDITDASLRVGTFGADLTIASHGSEDLASVERVSNSVTVTGLREKQAGDVYRVCQTQEQAWREKRRVRDLDELRARSGGIQLGASMNAAGQAAGDDDPVVRLRRAKEMLDNHLITDSEYESIKAKIVDRL